MSRHLLHDLESLKKHILAMGGVVEEAVHEATTALVQRRADVAEQIIEEDSAIDEMELAVDGECLKLLALHQPVAGDLRFITAVMKINNDLERIADLAVNIAERAQVLATLPPLQERLDFEAMTSTVRKMLRDSLDALITMNPELARDVCRRDDVIDELNRRHFETLAARMKRDSAVIDQCLLYLSASRHLERIADQTTNIAEDVVFMVEAVIIKHRPLSGATDAPPPRAAGRTAR